MLKALSVKKAKEAKATYSAKSVSVVTARGHTAIPRALRKRYRVTAKSRLQWTDTGEGMLVVPLQDPQRMQKSKANGLARPARAPEISAKNREFLNWLHEWMKEPDDWTPEQWDDFEKELRTNKLQFRDIEV